MHVNYSTVRSLYPTSAHGEVSFDVPGVPHLGELPYVFGFTMLQMPYNEHVANDSTIHFNLIEWTQEDIEHTDFFMRLLTHFVKTG